MLEALLEGQRHLAGQVTELISTLSTISQKQNGFAAKLDALTAKLDTLAARQDALEAGLTALTREVRGGSMSTTAA